MNYFFFIGHFRLCGSRAAPPKTTKRKEKKSHRNKKSAKLDRSRSKLIERPTRVHWTRVFRSIFVS